MKRRMTVSIALVMSMVCCLVRTGNLSMLIMIALILGCGPNKEKLELVRHACHQTEETIKTMRNGKFSCCNEKIQELIYSAEKMKRDRCNNALVEGSASTIDVLHKVLQDDLADIDEFYAKRKELDEFNKKRMQILEENLKVARSGQGAVKDPPGSLEELKSLIGSQEEIARRRLLRWKKFGSEHEE